MVQNLPIIRCVTCKVRKQVDPRVANDGLPPGWQRVGLDQDGKDIMVCPVCFRQRQR